MEEEGDGSMEEGEDGVRRTRHRRGGGSGKELGGGGGAGEEEEGKEEGEEEEEEEEEEDELRRTRHRRGGFSWIGGGGGARKPRENGGWMPRLPLKGAWRWKGGGREGRGYADHLRGRWLGPAPTRSMSRYIHLPHR